jgi:hypothetical protein
LSRDDQQRSLNGLSRRMDVSEDDSDDVGSLDLSVPEFDRLEVDHELASAASLEPSWLCCTSMWAPHTSEKQDSMYPRVDCTRPGPPLYPRISMLTIF